MELNSFVFPAPKPPTYSYLSGVDSLFFVPRALVVSSGDSSSSDFSAPPLSDHGITHFPCSFRLRKGRARKVLLYFHGNAEDLGSAGRFVDDVSSLLGVHGLAMEYPGYGIYPGDPSAKRVSAEALNFYDYVRDRLGCADRDMIVFGRSLGSGPATYVAAKRNPCMLILMSGFTSLKAVVNNVACCCSCFVAERFRNVDLVPKIACPKLFIHGKDDQLVPPACAQIMYEASSGQKHIELRPHMDHNSFDLKTDIAGPILRFWEEIGFRGEGGVRAEDLLAKARSVAVPAEYALTGAAGRQAKSDDYDKP